LIEAHQVERVVADVDADCGDWRSVCGLREVVSLAALVAAICLVAAFVMLVY
jgi:hypothetical protein